MKLNEKLLLTIGREYGSGGRQIARKLGLKLDIPVFDVAMLNEIAKKHGYDEEVLKTEDEKLANPFFSNYISYNPGATMLSDRLFLLQSDMIKEEADKGSGIFVGRCADDVLRDYEGLHSIFIYAPMEVRIQRIVQERGAKDADTAERIARKMDKQRRAYYQFYTDKKWGSTEGRDLMINSASLGIDGTVDFILDFYERMGIVSK